MSTLNGSVLTKGEESINIRRKIQEVTTCEAQIKNIEHMSNRKGIKELPKKEMIRQINELKIKKDLAQELLDEVVSLGADLVQILNEEI